MGLVHGLYWTDLVDRFSVIRGSSFSRFFSGGDTFMGFPYDFRFSCRHGISESRLDFVDGGERVPGYGFCVIDAFDPSMDDVLTSSVVFLARQLCGIVGFEDRFGDPYIYSRSVILPSFWEVVSILRCCRPEILGEDPGILHRPELPDVSFVEGSGFLLGTSVGVVDFLDSVSRVLKMIPDVGSVEDHASFVECFPRFRGLAFVWDDERRFSVRNYFNNKVLVFEDGPVVESFSKSSVG